MQPSSLAQDIRDAFLMARDEADQELARLSIFDPKLASLSAQDAVTRVRDHIESGPLWLALVRAYRGGSRSALASLLLEMLAPSLVAASIRLQPVPPMITEEDIRQDLVLEAFRAIAGGSLPRDPRWIPRHVILRATQAVARHLAIEKRRQDRQVPLDEGSADQVEATPRARLRIPHAQRVHPRAQNVRRAPSSTAPSMCIGEVGALCAPAAPEPPPTERTSLMNTASDHGRRQRQGKGASL